MNAAQYNAHVDRLLANTFAKTPAELQPCCKKGCHHCCYEAAYSDRRQIDHIIEGMTQEQLEEVKAKLPAWLEATKEIRKQRRPNAFDYRDLVVPCPLLKNGLCSVYARRPLDCRIFLALGNPDDCAMPARRHQKFADFQDAGMDVLTGPFIQSAIDAGEDIVLDHIGVLLAERLLGMDIPSAGRSHIKL